MTIRLLGPDPLILDLPDPDLRSASLPDLDSRHPALDGWEQGETGQVSDHHVRAMREKRVGVRVSIDSDDEAETTTATSLYSGESVLDYRGTRG